MSWNLRSLLAVNSKRPPCLTLGLGDLRRKTSRCRGATLGKSLSFLVLMLCNLGQDTFIDYLISECGLRQVTSLMIFLFQCCAALGRTLLLIILLPLLECGLGQITSLFSCCAALGKTLLIDYHGGVAFTSLIFFWRSMWIVLFMSLCRPHIPWRQCTSARVLRGGATLSDNVLLHGGPCWTHASTSLY
jgi:hypothetical protein